MMQETIVTLIVLCALAVVIKRYAPNTLKRSAKSWCARMATRIGWRTLAEKITEKAEDGTPCSTGCGSCGSCGTDLVANAPIKKNASISIDVLKRTIRR
jgi:hypothetical protein